MDGARGAETTGENEMKTNYQTMITEAIAHLNEPGQRRSYGLATREFNGAEYQVEVILVQSHISLKNHHPRQRWTKDGKRIKAVTVAAEIQ